MRIIRFIAALATLGFCAPALAQSSPGWTYGQVPTPGQWNQAFALKQDVLNYVPLNVAGGTMLGALYASPSTAVSAGLNLGVGIAPTSPNNGDIWATNANIYAYINGQTVTPFVLPSPCSGPVVGTSGGTITCYSSGLPAAYLAAGAAAANLGFTPLNQANNLSDLASATTARSNLGLGTAAVKAASASGGTVASVTGAFTAGHLASFADTAGTIQDGGTNGGGTVTSVALSLPAFIAVSGSPVTGSGTLTGTLATQTANFGFWGPASGSAAAPTFRAQVCADLPKGARCLLNTMTASNSAFLSDTTSLTSTYAHYDIVFTNLIPTTNAVTCEILLHSGGTFQTTGYNGYVYLFNSTVTVFSHSTYIPCTYDSYWATGGQGMSGTVHIDAPSQTAVMKSVLPSLAGPAASGGSQYIGGIAWFDTNTTAIDGFEVIPSSGDYREWDSSGLWVELMYAARNGTSAAAPTPALTASQVIIP